MTKYIKAPFNFVPLNDKVVEYKEPENISHTVPFEEGESGSIELTITAKTPVFIRNGSGNKEEKVSDFSHILDHIGKRRYFIPGTSLKGMFRNVLEVMSEGYLRIQKEMRFAVRDWNNPKVYPIKDQKIQSNLRCGWLEMKEMGDSILYDHDLPYRINHLALDEFFRSQKLNVSFEKEFSIPSGKRKDDLPDERKDASYKYQLLGRNAQLLKDRNFSRDNKFYCLVNNREHTPPTFTERRLKVNDAGSFLGTIVLTGQPDKWKNPQTDGERGMGDGKFYEFVFPSKKVDEFTIKKETIDQIKFIYQDSAAWKYFKGKGKVPVFFRTEKGQVKDFGLALLYKLPYEYTAIDLVKMGQNIEQLDDLIDIADSIFGSTKGGKKSSLMPFKGRVQFGHAFANKNAQEENEVIKRLGSPKASYLPIYIDQSTLGKNGKTTEYKSYHDKDALLSGWKRYPVHYDANFSGPEGGYNEKLDVKFKPLKAGTEFKTKVRFHNLMPYEVGALLSAITFHGNEKVLFHSLGMAKSHGFGKISVKANITGLQSDLIDYLEQYESFIYKQNNDAKWILQRRISELLTMAWDKKTEKDGLLLEYMKMDNEPNKNEFLSAKGGKDGKGIKEYLEKYTILTDKKFTPKSYLEDYLKKLQDENDKAEADKIEKEKADLEVLKIEREKAAADAIKKSQEKKAQEGLSSLSKHTDWNRAQKEINKYLKLIDVNQLPDDQSAILFEFLQRVVSSLNMRDLKEWKKDFAISLTWKKIVGWVGENKAKVWYEKIIK